MKIQDVLNNYKNLNTEINVIKSRIKYLKKLLSLENINNMDICQYFDDSKAFKKPLISRPTETQAINYDDFQQDNIKLIKEEIEKLESQLFYKEDIIERLSISIDSLSREEKFIIQSKYFDKMYFNDILLSMQKDRYFREKKLWCIMTVRRIHETALKKISSTFFLNTIDISVNVI